MERMTANEREIVEALRSEPCDTRLWWAYLRGEVSYAALVETWAERQAAR